MDYGADVDRGRWTDGLHLTRVVVVFRGALHALVCAPSILSEQEFRHVMFPRESRVLSLVLKTQHHPFLILRLQLRFVRGNERANIC
jgi:hypothetical protein